jgi:hypothetical protein
MDSIGLIRVFLKMCQVPKSGHGVALMTSQFVTICHYTQSTGWFGAAARSGPQNAELMVTRNQIFAMELPKQNEDNQDGNGTGCCRFDSDL